MARERSRHLGEFLLAAVLLAPTLAYSQQPPDTSSAQDPASANPPAQAPDNGSGSPIPAGVDQGLLARALNSANPLSGTNGPLQWGWVSIRSFSFVEYYGTATLNDPTTGGNVSESETASQFSTAIVLNHAFGASHSTVLTVQYTPSLFVTEGHVYTNALNQSAGVDIGIPINPRWALQISDRFNYYGSQRSFSGLSLDTNFSAGTVAQNDFLDGPGRVIDNTASGTISYLWSPLTKVSFTPVVGYENATGATNSQENLSAIYEGATVNVSRSLSATQTIGISYTGEHATYTNGISATSTPGLQTNGWQQDFLANYSQQIGQSWRVSAGLGLTGNSGAYSQTGLGINAGVSKSYHRMDFALNYDRGHQFNGYITGTTSDRVDLVNAIRWNRRFTSSTSVAYFRAASGPPPYTSGEYATEQLSFGLTRSLSLTGGVAYTRQSGDGVYLQSGYRILGTFGVTWSPAGSTQY